MTNHFRCFVTLLLGIAALGGLRGTPAMAQLNLGPNAVLDVEMRWRSELDGKDFESRTSMIEAATVRTLIGVRYNPDPTLECAFQMIDGRYLGSNTAVATPDENLGVQKAYIVLSPSRAHDARLELGRFEMSYGRERIISTGNWGFRRKFDGTRFLYDFAGGCVDLFATKINERALSTATESRDRDFYGAYSQILKRQLHLFSVLDWDRLKTNDRDALRRLTAGAFWTRKFGESWSVDADAAWQLGAVNGVDQEGYMAAVELRRSIVKQLKVGVGTDITSPDNPKTADRIETYNNGYYGAHAYNGYMEYFKTSQTNGMFDALIRMDWSPSTSFNLLCDVHNFRTMRDYTAADNSPSRALGQELDLTAKFKYSKRVKLQAGFSSFLVAKDWKDGADPSTWMYAMTTVSL